MRRSSFKTASIVRLVILMLMAAFMLSCAKPEVRDDYSLHCTLYIDCKSILNNMDMLNPDKVELVPEDGIILPKVTVGFEDGDSVYDIMLRELLARNIHIEAEFVPAFGTAYVEGINNLYEFDCGPMSGWEYRVNGVFPNYGCSQYKPKDGDSIEFLFTCDLGADVGNEYNE